MRYARTPIINLGNYLGKEPPNCLEAERAILGACLSDDAVAAETVTKLTAAAAFYHPHHRTLYAAFLAEVSNGAPVTTSSVLNRLTVSGEIDDAGGQDYVLGLIDHASLSVDRDIRVLTDKYRLRSILYGITETLHEIYTDPHTTSVEVGQRAEQRLADARKETGNAGEPVLMSEVCAKQYAELAAREGNPTPLGVLSGFRAIDDLVGAMMPGWVVVLAARPSVGKSALGMSIALRAAHAHQGVAFFSLEMTPESLAQRYMGGKARVSPHRFRSGQIEGNEYTDLLEAARSMDNVPLWLDFSPGINLAALKTKARTLVDQRGVRLLIVDYLQLIRHPDPRGRSKYETVTETSRDLKILAGELGVPIILLSQLNRGSENREGNRPRMSDLRDTGAIEEDADVVMLLHREEYYHKGDDAWYQNGANADKIGLGEVIVDKNRHGPTGLAKLHFVADEARFDDLKGPAW